MAGKFVDLPAAVIGMVLPRQSISDRVTAAYRRHLFGHATLQHLPDNPTFIFNSTNLETGVLMLFSKDYLGDYRIGRILKPNLELAVAVAASSAFPPLLSPCTLRLDGQHWVRAPAKGKVLSGPKFHDKIEVTDGGVYDNLGLEAAWKNYQSVIVSDAGGVMAYESDPQKNWAGQTVRVLRVIDNQVRALRKRQIVGSLATQKRDGMYVSTWSNLAKDFKKAVLPADHSVTQDLAKIPTRLKALNKRQQELLINWGYVICDAGLRCYYRPDEFDGKPATALPYPNRPLALKT
jgi:NTE family protein